MHRSREEPLAEFTAKAVVAGVVLGIVFGAANAYLGLRVGITISGANAIDPPAAVGAIVPSSFTCMYEAPRAEYVSNVRFRPRIVTSPLVGPSHAVSPHRRSP